MFGRAIFLRFLKKANMKNGHCVRNQKNSIKNYYFYVFRLRIGPKVWKDSHFEPNSQMEDMKKTIKKFAIFFLYFTSGPPGDCIFIWVQSIAPIIFQKLAISLNSEQIWRYSSPEACILTYLRKWAIMALQAYEKKLEALHVVVLLIHSEWWNCFCLCDGVLHEMIKPDQGE